jgi:hypothetical protein
MNRLFLIFVLLASVNASAMTWHKVRECDGGMVIDRGEEANNEGAPSYQLVVRNADVIEYFFQKGAIIRRQVTENGQYGPEFITTLFMYDGELKGFAGISPGLQFEYELHGSGNSIMLSALMNNGGRTEVANWVFHNCRSY